MASTTLRAGHDEQAHRTVRPLGDRHHFREQLSLVRRGLSRRDGSTPTSDIEQPHRHDDDVAIAGGLERGDHVIECVRVANRDEHVSRAGIDLIEREIGGGNKSNVSRSSPAGADAASRPTNTNHSPVVPIRAAAARDGPSPSASIVRMVPAAMAPGASNPSAISRPPKRRSSASELAAVAPSIPQSCKRRNRQRSIVAMAMA